jgi:polysaccharide deacetylase family protein (PEP-CTERM system associated)
MSPAQPLLNAFTVDVEEYFMVSAFESSVRRDEWSQYESRLAHSLDRLLGILDEAKVRATFFILGWVAEHHPDLVRKIADARHEIGCHGYGHSLLYCMTAASFAEDIRRARNILQDLSSQQVAGYRAPSFSLVSKTRWAIEILIRQGFRYDASTCPGVHVRGGFAGGQRGPHILDGLVQFPVSTVALLGRYVPFSGGGYLRLFPYWAIKRAFRLIHSEFQPVMVYVHPWELDTEQPRILARRLDMFRHYVNLRCTEPKVRRLLSDYAFASAEDVLCSTGLLP